VTAGPRRPFARFAQANMAYRECPIQHTDPGHTNPRARTPAPAVPTTIEGRRNLSSARTSRVSRVTPAWPPAPARYLAEQRARLKAPRQRHGDGMEKRVRPDACAGRNPRLSPAPHHSKTGSATHAATRWLMAPRQPPRGSSPASAAQRGPRKPPDLAALGVVHGGEPSRPPEGRPSLPVGPAHLFNPNCRYATGNADEVRSGAVITSQCSRPPGAILQGQIRRTNCGQMIKKSDRRLAIGPLTCISW
jgi:hypothetical protein